MALVLPDLADAQEAAESEEPILRDTPVETDMAVPAECVIQDHIVCGRLATGTEATVIIGGFCVHIKNVGAEDLFIPMRTDEEIYALMIHQVSGQAEFSACLPPGRW